MEKDYFWYKLFCTEGIGNKTMHKIFEAIQKKKLNIQDVFRMSENEFRKMFSSFKRLKKDSKITDFCQQEEKLRREYMRLKQQKIKIIHLEDELYPRKVLKRLKRNAPPVLFCKGNLNLLKYKGVSIVGARNATKEALDIARKLASDLVECDINVISGYAKGVDEMAHFGALEKEGTTTLILSYGIYKFKKKKIFKAFDFEKKALIISQFAPQDEWKAWRAMTRNELICAFAEAVIVVEAILGYHEYGGKSGTFNAGETALKIGVPLYVIDPEILSNKPLGNTLLIEKGGIKINPDDGIKLICEEIYKTEGERKDLSVQEQKSLF